MKDTVGTDGSIGSIGRSSWDRRSVERKTQLGQMVPLVLLVKDTVGAYGSIGSIG